MTDNKSNAAGPSHHIDFEEEMKDVEVSEGNAESDLSFDFNDFF